MPTIKSEWIERGREKIRDFRRLQEAGLICLDGDFVPSVHYPPITMYPPLDEETLFAGYRAPADGRYDIYVHIPFCERQCVFCHYPVLLNTADQEKERYLDALETEMDLYMRRLGLRTIAARSILIGGGTPTHLTPAQLDRFLRSFTSRLDMGSVTQFNYDLDPGSIIGSEGAEKIEILKSHGVNRLTLGIQSFNPGILKKMNRPHDEPQAVEGIERSLRAGFVTNIEFIFGYPGETLEGWVETLEKAVSLGTDEIQIYRLKIRPYGDRTGPIAAVHERNAEVFPEIEDVLMMKQAAASIFLENGYRENLRRVFSKKADCFSHYADNQCCGLLDQIGFGQTAFSSLADRFGLNTPSVPEYYARIEAGKLPVDRGIVRSRDEQMRWAVVLPLKNRKVWKNYFKKITGASLNGVFGKKIESLKSFGLLHEDDEALTLTELGGFFADEVCQQFHHADHIPFPRTAYAEAALNPYADGRPR